MTGFDNARRGIPTMHAHTRFRSRLEARWAAFFDAIGWRWEYEPFDLDGYVPDFVLLGSAPVLVEVKPVTSFVEAERIAEGLQRFGEYESLVIGCTPFLTYDGLDDVVGAVGQDYGTFVAVGVEPGPVDVVYAPAAWAACWTCERLSVVHLCGGWVSHPTGCEHRKSNHPGLTDDATLRIERAWAGARNRTQWRSR